MRNHSKGLGAVLIAVWGTLLPTVAAQSPGVDPAGMDEAIAFLQQARSAEEFEQAAANFTALLEQNPDDRAALLFRALANGESALLQREFREIADRGIREIEEFFEMRSDPTRVTAVEQEIAAYDAALSDENLDAAERLIATVARQRRADLLDLFQRESQRTDEELRAELATRTVRAADASRLERRQYEAMLADLERLLPMLEQPEVIVRLLEVVARTKVARLNEEEAVQIESGELEAPAASAPTAELRSVSSEMLRRAADVLEQLLSGSDLSGEDRARGTFFLGVIRYRQAVPRRAERERPDIDYALLADSERHMAELADDESVAVNWRSYAALYMGMMIPFRASIQADDAARKEALDEADRRLTQAARLDVLPSAEVDGTPVSASGDVIPWLVARQRLQIRTLRAAAPAAAPRRNDLQLTMTSGVHRDTNVVLLGERTDLPRDISRKADFGFTLGTAIDYTLDLSDRLSLGVQGRMAQLWHADVDEFDEQQYGMSAALQYELMHQSGDFGPVQLRLQYDYDYTLLGRDPFLEAQAITPNVRIYWHNRRAETNFYFSYAIRDYQEPLRDRRFDRDGEYLSIGGVQSYKLVDMTAHYKAAGIEPWGHPGDQYLVQDDEDYPARYLRPYLGLQYGWDATEGDEFDQKEITLLFGVNVPLPYGVDMGLGVDLEWQDYQHGSLIDFHRRGRRDLVQQYSLGLSRTFVLCGGEIENRYTPTMDRVLMTIRAHPTYTNDDSNVKDRLGQAIFEYDRAFYGVSVAFTFN